MLQMLRFAKEVLLHIWLTSVNTHEQGIGARGVNSGLSPCRTTFTLGDVHHEVLELWMASDISLLVTLQTLAGRHCPCQSMQTCDTFSLQDTAAV